MARFNMSEEVALLGVTLNVLGWAAGPLLWAGLSELFGRRLPFIAAALGFTIFSWVASESENTATLLAARALVSLGHHRARFQMWY